MPAVEPFGLLDGAAGGGAGRGAGVGAAHRRGGDRAVAGRAAGDGAATRSTTRRRTTVGSASAAKAAELGVGVRARSQRMRARYAAAGPVGAGGPARCAPGEVAGRADARLVAAVRRGDRRAETDASTGTRSRLIRRVIKQVEATHGPGVVPLPGRTTLLRLIDALSAGRHTFGSAVTRRQTGEPPGRGVHPDVRRPAGRAGADRLHPDRRDGAAGRRGGGARGSDHRGRRGDPHDLRGGAAPGRHQGGRRRAAAGPDAGPGADAAGLGRGAADVGLPAAARRGCWTSTRGCERRRPGR